MLTYVPAPSLGEPIEAEWRIWGPYLADRQWGTVREDYSEFGTAWDFFPHDHARSRVYRWGEDGLLGISDDQQLLCFGLALWNGTDSILKERLFGLTGSEGNHGEDVKEYYWHLDATPTHSYLRGLYKYPQCPFPYQDIVEGNRNRNREQPEYELIDTGIFAEDRYFDVFVEYAKVSPTDILIRISATNRGPDPAPLQILPSIWFRNTWSWGLDDRRPSLEAVDGAGNPAIHVVHHQLGEYWLECSGNPDLLFTENETNSERLWNSPNQTPYVKDGIDQAIVTNESAAVNPGRTGTKAAARYAFTIAPGGTDSIVLRLSTERQTDPFATADRYFVDRVAEADTFYAEVAMGRLSADEALVQRQAFAGLIWTKQVFNFDVARWLDGDPAGPPPPAARKHGRNSQWRHHNSNDVISMPDKWEYPWYAAWDHAFHCIPFGLIDRGFAKDQLQLLLREWYMHPNGQIPAYEWAFGDVNPPVHIAATRFIYQDELRRTGTGDRAFLARVFHKLLLNFTWWVNRKDEDGRNLFQGGFLGLDNISVIDRSMGLPPGIRLEQADGTAWMASYCLNMAWAAVVLSEHDATYEDLATKFLQHYIAIGGAMNGFSDDGASLWDDEDGFYYDFVQRDDGARIPLKVRSLVGLLPIFPSIGVTDGQRQRLRENSPSVVDHLRTIAKRHPELASLFEERTLSNGENRLVLTLVPEDRIRRVLTRMFDPDEFLGDYGIRSISQHYRDQPYELHLRDQTLTVKYEPAESSSGMFGGNSNWRGPIWLPMNLLLVQGIRNLYGCYGDDFMIEYPTGSGEERSLDYIADDISRRLVSLFLRNKEGNRPVFGGSETMQNDPLWRDYVHFYEYFHGDNGAGIGASHQTGWTAVVANLIELNAAGAADKGLAPATATAGAD